MEALIANITFSEALFKMHYTKGFRETYPIPLPSSVAGIFGALLGIERDEIKENFNDCLFGAKLLYYKGLNPEITSYIQFKAGEPIRGATTSIILNNPSFIIALVTRDEKIKEFYEKIKKNIIFLPYGGQNDFFVQDIESVEIKNVNEKTLLIENYAPQDLVTEVQLNKGTEVWILPVRHKLSPNPNFYFIFKGCLKLKRPIFSVENIGVYSLSDFYYLSP